MISSHRIVSLSLFFLLNSLVSAVPERAIISGGTVKTASGELLRGMSLHISKTYSANNLSWGLDTNNLIKVKNAAHLNFIRLNCLDPRAIVDGKPDKAFSTISEEAVYTDSVVANCGKVGLYVILNYHCMGHVWDNSTWDIRNFWDFYAPRYKDKTWVLYEIENETYQGDAPTNTDVTAWPLNNEISIYKNHIRKWAPNTLIMGMFEPVELKANWGPYLRDVLGPAFGINWNSGKDAWAFHPYGGTNPAAIKATQAAGIPIICTESSYPEEGWGNATLDGYHYPIEWCERNGVAWADWHLWNKADQLYPALTYLLPDATKKGYAWWGTSTINLTRSPSTLNLDRENISPVKMHSISGQIIHQKRNSAILKFYSNKGT